MGRTLTLTKLTSLVCLSVLGLSLTACDNVVFTSSNAERLVGANDLTIDDEEEVLPGDLLFIDDSFERDDIYEDVVTETIYGWRGFILDGANAVFGFQSNGAGARIPPIGEFGPAAHGDRFLLLNGREGQEIETIHVVSQSYDLSQFNTAILSFRYLTFNLNDADDTVPEGLELQVCRGSLNECGANDDALSAAGQTSNNWVTVATNDSIINDDAFNGKNHAVTDWNQGIALIDLHNPELVGDGSTFVFRFRAAMRDGLMPDTTIEVCEEVCDEDGDEGDCECKEHHDNGKHNGFDHSKHYGYGKHKHCCKCCVECTDEETGEECKHDNGQHVGFDHSKHYGYGKHCKKHCCKCCDDDNCEIVCHEETVPSDGTLKDGVGIDKVRGVATPRTIDEIL